MIRSGTGSVKPPTPANVFVEAPPIRGPVDDAVIAEVARRIAEARPGCCVLLFGSRARGDFHEESDIDLIVITEEHEKGPLTVAGELYGLISDRDFSVDLVVMTPERFRERRSRFDPFMHDALAEGRLLHGVLP